MGWIQLKEGRSLKLSYFSSFLTTYSFGVILVFFIRASTAYSFGVILGFFLRASTTYSICVILVSSSGHPRLTYSASSWLLRQGIHDLLTRRHPGFFVRASTTYSLCVILGVFLRASTTYLLCVILVFFFRASTTYSLCVIRILLSGYHRINSCVLYNTLLCKGMWGEEFIGFKLCGF